MKRLDRKGFTLVELLVVIAVTSLVLGLSAYGIINAYNKAKEQSLVLNEKSILEAARIYSAEAKSNVWKALSDDSNNQYFCTTIQRLKNAGLLKKEAKSEEYGDATLITVQRDATTFNVKNVSFLEEESTEVRNLCDIRFFTIHYEYNAGNETGTVPSDQLAEICTGEICMDTNISLYIPKRNGYRFVGWNTESNYSGIDYDAGQSIQYDSEDTLVLYARWEEDSYTIKYNANSIDATGSMQGTICTRNENCTLAPNSFTRTGYAFDGWNTESDGTGTKYNDEAIINFNPSNDEKNLYAMWKSQYKVIIKFNVGTNGQIRENTTSSSGVNYKWRTDSNGVISRSRDNGSYVDSFFSISYNSSDDLPNYNNTKYMYITNVNSDSTVSLGSVWKCTSGECNGKTYNQTASYDSNDFCNALNSDCTVVLSVNWENKDLLSPIITPSDGIASGHWHNKAYTLTISSSNTNNPTYEFKVGTGNFQTYTAAISPSEGKTIYTARTKVGVQYSGGVQYESWLDSTKPTVPVIYNPSGGNWTKNPFSLTLSSTDNLSGIQKYQYKYDGDSSWRDYPNSSLETYNTENYYIERNKELFVRACDNAGNCSDPSSTWIKIDKTYPNAVTINNPSGGEWTKNNFALTLSTTDNLSGIARYEYKFDGDSSWSAYSNSSGNTYTTANYSQERNKKLYIRACDLAENCSNVSTTWIRIDKTDPTATFTMKNGSTVINANSNNYNVSFSTSTTPTTPSTAPNWINYSPTLVWSASDSMSGVDISLENNFGFNKQNNPSLVTTESEIKYFTTEGNSNGVFSSNVGSDGYRYIRFKICDKANNCIYSHVFMRMDQADPTATFTMKNGNTVINASSNYYNASFSTSATPTTPSTAPNWINYGPTLVWSASDGMSGINVSLENNFNYNNQNNASLVTSNMSSSSVSGNSNGVFSYTLNSGGYRYIRFKICDNANNCIYSHDFMRIDNTLPSTPTINNPSNGNWTKNDFPLTVSSTDSISGIARYERKFEDDASWGSYSNSSGNTYTTANYSEQRNKKLYIRACDYAGNCSKEAASTWIRIDKTSPTVSFQMLNASNNDSIVNASGNYSTTPSNNLKWFTFVPKLRWIATDSLSGINTTGRYYFNDNSKEDITNYEDFPTTGGYALTGTLSSSNTYYFDNPVSYGGYRKYKAKICDNAENCTEDTRYFKYYANDAVERYANVSSSSSLRCRFGPSTSDTIKTNFSCGTYLANIVKTYNGNWYYSPYYGCYVSGDYLSTTRPNCSSGGSGGGGGSSTNPNCNRCDSKAQCTPGANGVTVRCINGYCMYSGDGGTSFGCS